MGRLPPVVRQGDVALGQACIRREIMAVEANVQIEKAVPGTMSCSYHVPECGDRNGMNV